MNLVKEESVESCVKKNAEDFFPTFEEFYSTWSALDSIEVKDGLLVNLLINEKVVSKLREKAGSEVDLFDLVSHFSRIWSITEQRAWLECLDTSSTAYPQFCFIQLKMQLNGSCLILLPLQNSNFDLLIDLFQQIHIQRLCSYFYSCNSCHSRNQAYCFFISLINKINIIQYTRY